MSHALASLAGGDVDTYGLESPFQVFREKFLMNIYIFLRYFPQVYQAEDLHYLVSLVDESCEIPTF